VNRRDRDAAGARFAGAFPGVNPAGAGGNGGHGAAVGGQIAVARTLIRGGRNRRGSVFRDSAAAKFRFLPDFP